MNNISLIQKMFLELNAEQQNAIIIVIESMLGNKVNKEEDLVLESFSEDFDVFKEDKKEDKKEDVKVENINIAEDSNNIPDIETVIDNEVKTVVENSIEKAEDTSNENIEESNSSSKTIGPVKLVIKDYKVDKYCLAIGLDSYCKVNEINTIEAKKELLEKLIDKSHEYDNISYPELFKLQNKFGVKDVKGIEGVRNNVVRRLKIAAIELRVLNA